MAFRACLAQADLLKRIVQGVKDLLVEINLRLNKHGISLQAMDGSHVALVVLNMWRNGFVGDKIDADGKGLVVGVPMKSLVSVMNCADKKDTVRIEVDQDQKLQFVFENKAQNRLAQYSLHTMDIDSEHLSLPKIVYKNTARLLSSEFKRVVDAMHTLGDTLVLTFSQQGLEFCCKGAVDKVHLGKILMQPTHEADPSQDTVVIKLEENAEDGKTQTSRVTLATRYLCHFAKSHGVSEYVSIKMTADSPLLVHYDLFGGDDGKTEVGALQFYLAPKIEDEPGAF